MHDFNKGDSDEGPSEAAEREGARREISGKSLPFKCLSPSFSPSPRGHIIIDLHGVPGIRAGLRCPACSCMREVLECILAAQVLCSSRRRSSERMRGNGCKISTRSISLHPAWKRERREEQQHCRDLRQKEQRGGGEGGSRLSLMHEEAMREPPPPPRA